MGNSPYSTLVLIALMVVAFYFLIIRPNKKRQLAQQATMSSLQPGTRVLLTSGIFGTIVEIGEKQAVLELSPGVHLTVLKQAIARAVKPGDEDAEFDSADDEPYDEIDDLPMTSAETYGADSIGTNSSSSGPTSTGPASTPTSTGPTDAIPTDRPSPWSADAQSYPSATSSTSDDQDPRPGTNTTPIKD